MFFIFSKHRKRLFALAAVLLCLGLIVALVYSTAKYSDVSKKYSALEREVAMLSQLVKDSSSVTEENKKEIQEIANRREVIAKSQDELLTSAVAEVSPSVVSIVISKDVALLEVQYVNPFGDDPFFRDVGFRVPTYRRVGTEKKQVGAGTGFLITQNGYIATNRHVVDEKGVEYTVLLSDGSQKAARVVYVDNDHDLAVVKIEGSGYPTVALGDSSQIQLGQTVVAIGNALGEYNNSVSVGIVSGLNRTIQAGDSSGNVETLAGVIQTDAAINRGNSGGPLLNLDGEVIGINVAVDSSANNIAFSIPVNILKSVLKSI